MTFASVGYRRLAACAVIAAFTGLLIFAGCAKRSAYSAREPSAPAARPETAPPETRPGQPRPYRALGQWYVPLSEAQGFRQKGIASGTARIFTVNAAPAVKFTICMT